MTPRHPAPYTPAVLEVMRSMIEPGWRVLDPMAGIGRVHQLCPPAADTVGVEIEPNP